MSFVDDKELNEYRNIMQPPKEASFSDGFNWKAVVGAMVLGFIVNPATDYLSLVIGNDAHIGGAMKWVMIIFFAEVAKRSFTTLKTQELYVLHFMAGAALADPFTGYLWTQYVAQSEYVQGLGLAAELPKWAFPAAAELKAAGRTFLTTAWLPVVALTVINMILGRFVGFGLGYVLYRITSDVEKLPFPFAPVSAAGIVALSTDRGEETKWRWRCFAIGGMMGMTWAAVYLVIPLVTGAILPKRVELIPLIFIDLTPQITRVLAAVPFNLVLNFGAFLGGMIVPFWGVMGAVFGLVFTMIFNPILQDVGVLSSWRADMGFIDTQWSNNIDFYLSFGMGLTLAVTFSKLFIFASTLLRNKIKPSAKELPPTRSFGSSIKEGWRVLVTNNTARGDFSIFLAIFFYFMTTFVWIGMGVFLIGTGYPWKMMVFYALIYTPLISYATAKLEGICGQAVSIPYLDELTIMLSGYKGAQIWFAPRPIQNLGAATVGFRVMELTGSKVISKVKTLLITLPIVLVASFATAEVLWRMAPVPSAAYPYTEMMWELNLRRWCIMKTSTLEGGSQFLESLHPDYILWGLCGGGGLFAVLAFFGLPVMLVFGAVWGLGQSSPGAIFCTLLGALLARFHFKRKYKDMWLKYMTAIMAGFGCGMGLISMVAMSFNVIVRMVKPLAW